LRVCKIYIENVRLGHVVGQVLLAEDVQAHIGKLKVVTGCKEIESVLGWHINVVVVDVTE
jgi:hypothetical protein